MHVHACVYEADREHLQAHLICLALLVHLRTRVCACACLWHLICLALLVHLCTQLQGEG